MNTENGTLSLSERAQQIRLLALDVDGVLTDGSLTYFSADSSTAINTQNTEQHCHESKTFNTQDGLGIKLLQKAGIEVAIITGRASPMVHKRANELGIPYLYQGRNDKLAALVELSEATQIPLAEIAYCGDDLPDLAAIRAAGLGTSVANAPAYIRVHAQYVTEKKGGEGAVREVAELLLQAQGKWNDILAQFIDGNSSNYQAG